MKGFWFLAELTYSLNLLGGELFASQCGPPSRSDIVKRGKLGKLRDYNQFWHDHKYLLRADQVKAEVVFTHGSQTGTLSPFMSLNVPNSSSKHQKKHLFYHNGAPRLPLNNWQSIDFRHEHPPLLKKLLWATIQAMNCLQSGRTIQGNKLDFLGWLWQSNKSTNRLPGRCWKVIKTATRQKRLRALWKAYPTFLTDLCRDKAQQVTIWPANRRPTSTGSSPSPATSLSTNKGLLSAQLLELGSKYLNPIRCLSVRTLG